MIAKDLITNDLPILVLRDRVYNALNMMDAFGVSHLPIVQHGKYIGLVSENQLFQVCDPSLEVSSCHFTQEGSSVFDDQHLLDVTSLVAKLDLTLIPVLKRDNTYIGSIVAFGLISHLNNLLGVEYPGTIVVLELNTIDYSLSQISQIVEYNNSKILSLYTRRDADSRKMSLTLKIESDNINSILESFERYDYKIKSIFNSDDSNKDIYADRYDNLMNYLNI
jgi:predicted transcriptional regulator